MEALRFGRLTLPLMDALFRLARRLTRSDADAKDLLQQTYLEAFRSIASLSDPQNVRSWMYCILRNLWLDEQRRRHRRPPLEVLEGEDEPPALIGDLEQELLREGLSQELADALEALPEEFRWAVLLVDIEGLSYGEAAEVMGCPLGTVRSRLSRAREGLIARLQRLGARAIREGGQA